MSDADMNQAETCTGCSRPMVRSMRAWRRLSAAQRNEYVVHSGHGYCEACVSRRRRSGDRGESQRQRKVDDDGQRLPPCIHRRGKTYCFKYIDATGKERYGSRPTLAAALEAQAELKAEVARQRAELAAQRRAWRARVYRASMRAAEVRAEKREAAAAAELDAIRRESQRLARAIKQLPPDLKGGGRALTHVIKAAQELDRAARAAEGMTAVRLRAAQDPLYDVEDSVKRALFGDQFERHGGFRATGS